MMLAEGQLVATIPERCRICYTCVRDCPAKAIRISGGQAEVVAERCIGCGNCVKVCSRGAKTVRESKIQVSALLDGDARTAAIVAPSFPAEFTDIPPHRLAGALRALGFDLVCEVAFGADLVARRYNTLLATTSGCSYIATTCPAVVSYVEKFEPELVPDLAPVASPMTAMARVMHRLHGPDLSVVFIGPCIAKKAEAEREGISGDVAAAISFAELRGLFAERGIDPAACAESDYDGPRPGLGALFPVSHGMLQAAGLSENLLTNEVVVGSGLYTFRMMLREFGGGDMPEVRLLELLSCKGCVMGAGMTSEEPMVRRRTRVGDYVRRALNRTPDAGEPVPADFDDLDLSVDFAPHDTRMSKPSEAELRSILTRLGKESPEEELDCGACGYRTCRDHAVAIHTGMAESEMCLPLTIGRLKESLISLHRSHEELEETQHALIQSEKLASMGQLSAGIAHEVNNPLGVVLLYAGMLLEECPPESPLHDDLVMVVEQAGRCKNVVSGLLDFARRNDVDCSAVHLGQLLEQAVRGIVRPDGVKITVTEDMEDPIAQLDRDQMLRVLTNLLKNGVEAMPGGGVLALGCDEVKDRVRIRVADTGIGIKPEHMQKIFEPLFTTKTMGKGTGLGLAVSYGIVKMHRGSLTVRSNCDPAAGATGTTFEIVLPRTQRSQ